jgi:hypothetical protein
MTPRKTFLPLRLMVAGLVLTSLPGSAAAQTGATPFRRPLQLSKSSGRSTFPATTSAQAAATKCNVRRGVPAVALGSWRAVISGGPTPVFADSTPMAGALSTGAAVSAATPDEVARRWAPIHYQDTDSDSPREDYLALFTYDTNFNGNDNWDHLDSIPLEASVYYAVAETCTHWFISYGFYHPHDWSDGILTGRDFDRHGYLVDEGEEHENDMEDALVVVRKGQGAPDYLEAVLTQGHGGYLAWLPAGSPLVAGPGHTIRGTIPQAEFPAGSGELHPETAQHAKGHAVGAKDAFSDFAGEPDRDGIIYWPTGVPGEPASGNDRDAHYGLEAFLAPGGLVAQQLWEDLLPAADRVTYVKWGNFRGDESGGCGDDIVTCKSNAAGPPWGQDDDSEEAPRGAPVLDPADMVQYHFAGFDDYDLDYVTNGFIVALRDAGYGPQPDGTIRQPDGYAGPALATYFNKLVDVDEDGDGIDRCTERAAGTDPQKSDTDNDGLSDGIETSFGTDPLDADSDDDGLTDGTDVEFVQNALNSVATSVFKSPGAGTLSAALTRLDEIEGLLLSGKEQTAIKKLLDLRLRIDGCGASPDANDWIVDCGAQAVIRSLVDVLIENIRS